MRNWISLMRGTLRSERTLAELDREVQFLKTALLGMQTEIEVLRRLVKNGRQVDYVDFGELRVFMYSDDLGYQEVLDQYKHQTPAVTVRDLSRPLVSPTERYRSHNEPLAGTLLGHHWLHDIDFCVFDIGCQYGTSAMAAAQVILASGRANHVYAFDPGVAGELAPYNIILNGMVGRVTFERTAVSNTSLPGLVFTELGHSENNRVVNRALPTETLSYVTPRITVDEYVRAQDIGHHLVMKIDTQGGEVEVFEGMRETRKSRFVTCLTEFTPMSIETRVPPKKWLMEVSEGCTIFNVGHVNPYLTRSHKLQLVPERSYASFVDSIVDQATPYTDLLIIPNNLPGYGELLEKFS